MKDNITYRSAHDHGKCLRHPGKSDGGVIYINHANPLGNPPKEVRPTGKGRLSGMLGLIEVLLEPHLVKP